MTLSKYLIRRFLALAAVLVFCCCEVNALADAPIPPSPTPVPTLFNSGFPYAPRKSEPSIDFGVSQARDEFFVVGGSWGTHLGECVFVHTDTCQQYLDGTVNWMIRDGHTHLLGLASLRWQYVNIPDRMGSFWRLAAGGAQLRDEAQDRWVTAVGIGGGLNLYLHPNYDLRLEARFLALDRIHAMALVGVQIKIDRLVESLARRLRDLGYTTLETGVRAAGEAVRATGEGLEGVYDEVKDKGKKLLPEKVK